MLLGMHAMGLMIPFSCEVGNRFDENLLDLDEMFSVTNGQQYCGPLSF